MSTNEHAAYSTAGFFNQEMAAAYDARNRGLQPISDCLHFLMRLVLAELPTNARVLCVGVGTGAEILSLAQAYPGWTFHGVDPSAEMLEVGRHRLAEAGIVDRCTLQHGYVGDVAATDFDAAVSLLVAHFVGRGERPEFYRAIHDRLQPEGRFVSAEISADLNAPVFPAMLTDWRQVHRLMGATAESLEQMPVMLRDVLSVIPATETKRLWREAGFSEPVSFFQSFLVRGWHAVKSGKKE